MTCLRHVSRQQRGLALLVAMLVAALAAAVAVSLAAGESRWSSQVLHRRDQVQAQSIAQAGVQWARQILADTQGGPVDSLNEPWALPLPATPIENGTVEGNVVDAQGMLDVNDLASPTHGGTERRRFVALLASLGLPASALPPIANWVTAQRKTASAPPQSGGGSAALAGSAALSGTGALPGTAASPSGGLPGALRVQELAEVPGMTLATLGALVPRIAALPLDVPLNVNTAPPEVLAAAITNLDSNGIAALIADRRTRPFNSIADLRARLPAGAALGDETMISVGSRYFLVNVRAQQGQTVARAHALLARSGSGWPTILWQTVE